MLFLKSMKWHGRAGQLLKNRSGSNYTRNLNMAPRYDVLCRIIFLGSLAFESTNQIVVEFSTPRSVAPHGVSLCFTDPSYSQVLQDVSVSSLTTAAAGSWRDLQTVDLLRQPGPSWRSSTFFSTRNGLQDAIEGGSPSSLLSGDSFYDSSFAIKK